MFDGMKMKMKIRISMIVVILIVATSSFLIAKNKENSCEVIQYSGLFELQNKIFHETAESLKVNDSESYSLLEEYIFFHIETNELNIYIVEEIESLEGIESKHFNTLGKISEFLQGPKTTGGFNEIFYPYDSLLKNDVFYTKKREYLSPLFGKYYYGVGMSDEESNKYWVSRKKFEQHMKLNPMKKQLKDLWVKPFTELCKT